MADRHHLPAMPSRPSRRFVVIGDVLELSTVEKASGVATRRSIAVMADHARRLTAIRKRPSDSMSAKLDPLTSGSRRGEDAIAVVVAVAQPLLCVGIHVQREPCREPRIVERNLHTPR